MKIIFLNTWNAEAGSSFTDFIRLHEKDTDVFCLMEVRERAMEVCRTALPRHVAIVAAKAQGNDAEFTQATFFAPHVRCASSEVLFGEREDTGLGLYTELVVENVTLHILNFHGKAMPGDKLDNSDRINGSRDIIAFMREKRGPVIIGGDFNLLPETESVLMFGKNSFHDLIREYNISTTRNELAWKNYPSKQYFADYVFTNTDVTLKSFAVPQNEVSDHLPLIIEIEI